MIPITDEKISLVQKFVDTFNATQESLNSGDREGAINGYKDLLDTYNEISSSDLEAMHKELAHDQLVKIYDALQNPPKHSIHTTTHIIAAAVLLMLFSFLVFFRPAISGFTTVEQMPSTIHDLNWAFIESEKRAIHLDAAPNSIRLNGKIDGAGFVRVYATTPYERVLVFDNDMENVGRDGVFSGACTNTCTSGVETQDFELDVVVQNAALTIYSIEYT